MPKFLNDKKATLNNSSYFDVFERKGVKFLRIRRTKDFSPLVGIEFEILKEHIWTKTDSLIKLSNKYYRNSENWWTIAILNGKPTDAHYSIGDVVYIPQNPTQIIESMR